MRYRDFHPCDSCRRIAEEMARLEALGTLDALRQARRVKAMLNSHTKFH